MPSYLFLFKKHMLSGEVKVAEKLSDNAYKHIIRKILTSELVSGQKISEQTIAAECGISRTPVREAIRGLIQEGVLYQIPSIGTFVAHVDRNQIQDAYEMRALIECAAIHQAVRTLTKESRQELRRLCDEMHCIIVDLRLKKKQVLEGDALVSFLSFDLLFHLLLLKAAGNRLAIQIVTSAYQRNQFFGHHSHRRDLQHLAWVWRHHSKIERALRQGDAPKAECWMRAHIIRSQSDALAAFDQAAANAANAGRDPVSDALAQLIDRFE
jgi:DNA-binding GntR family transcriptional regulator